MQNPLLGARSIAAFGIVLAGFTAGCADLGHCGQGCASDAGITAQVLADIRQHPALEAPNLVRVQTVRQVVYLNGQVETELQRSLAEELAREVPGVKRVVNSINFSYQGP